MRIGDTITDGNGYTGEIIGVNYEPGGIFPEWYDVQTADTLVQEIFHTDAILVREDDHGTTEDAITYAYTSGDCWALALAGKEAYSHLDVVVLAEWEDDDETEDGQGWTHALLYDPATGKYWDIYGAQDYPGISWEWDYMYTVTTEELSTFFDDQTRFFPEVTIAEGLNQMGYRAA